MACPRNNAARRRSAAARGLAFVLAFTAATTAAAKVFRLTTGGALDGQLLGQEHDEYEIRTAAGVVRIPISAVRSIEDGRSLIEEYDERAAGAPATAAGQFELATWCGENGLASERRKHLLRAIGHDGDYRPARRALGQVRVGELWVDGGRGGARAARGAEGEADPERVVRAIQGQWAQRIRAIRQNLIDSATPALAAEGREKLLAIKDPLAILPLVQQLGEGGTAQRLLLVEALSGFAQDEATLNLAVLGLLDDAVEVRGAALTELERRNDPRVAQQYRLALRSRNEGLIRRAAGALARFGVKAAVAELIELLTERQNRIVEVPVEQALYDWPTAFAGVTVIVMGERRVEHRPAVGVYWPASFNDAFKSEWQTRSVIVYRTEVLEALKQLTGQNFGFEREAWQRWLQGGGGAGATRPLSDGAARSGAA